MKRLISIAIISFVVVSCAAPYRAIRPETLLYQNENVINDKLKVSYFYDAHGFRGNKRYAKKEKKNFSSVVGIKITNIGSEPVNLNPNNFVITSGQFKKQIIPVELYAQQVKQTVPLYLLHTLWGPTYYETDMQGNVTETQWLPIGLAIGVANCVVAASANSRHKQELTATHIYGRSVSPGKTIYGTVVLQNISYDPLGFELIEAVTQE